MLFVKTKEYRHVERIHRIYMRVIKIYNPRNPDLVQRKKTLCFKVYLLVFNDITHIIHKKGREF